MRLEMTCPACPEQYDVFHGKLLVGYLRLRHGQFRADFIHPETREHETVYSSAPKGDGMFEDSERQTELDNATAAIRKRLTRYEKSKS